MANRWFTQFFYTLHKKPVLIDCNFIVDAPNGNGLGQRSLKGPGVTQVYMHTTSTPAGPFNPASGYIYVQFDDQYNRYYGGFSGQVSPVSGTPINVTTGTTAGLAYTIVSVGTTTTAQWQKLGLPVGYTPTVGQSFIAIATTTATGTGVIEVPATNGSGIDHIEVVGDPNTTLKGKIGVTGGGYIILACFSGGTLTAPAAGSAVGLSTYLSSTSSTAAGE